MAERGKAVASAIGHLKPTGEPPLLGATFIHQHCAFSGNPLRDCTSKGIVPPNTFDVNSCNHCRTAKLTSLLWVVRYMTCSCVCFCLLELIRRCQLLWHVAEWVGCCKQHGMHLFMVSSETLSWQCRSSRAWPGGVYNNAGSQMFFAAG